MTQGETWTAEEQDRLNRLYREAHLEKGSKFRNGAYGALGSGGMVRILLSDLKWLLKCVEELDTRRISAADADAAEHHPDA